MVPKGRSAEFLILKFRTQNNFKAKMEKAEEPKPETLEQSTDVCAREGCENPAGKMSCPTCVSLKLPLGFYCSQDCFKKAWGAHKKSHPPPIQYWKPPQSFDGYRFTGSLRPGKVTEMKRVRTQIPFPDYGITSYPNEEMQSKADKNITVHTEKEIATLRETAILARRALDVGARKVAVGVTTNEIDNAVHDFIVGAGAYPSPLNYFGFPKSLCTYFPHHPEFSKPKIIDQ
jgi:methionyl aminopeptidase